MPCSSLIAPPSDESTQLSPDHSGSTNAAPFHRRMIEEYQLLFQDRKRGLLLCLTLQWICINFGYNALVLYDGDVIGYRTNRRENGFCSFDYQFNTLVGFAEVLGPLLMIPLLERPNIWIGGRKGAQIFSYTLGLVTLGLLSFTVQLQSPTYAKYIWATISRGMVTGGQGVLFLQGA